MVMKKNAMRKNLRQSIFQSFGRYIAIVAIIALGASLFVGLLMTKTDMVATGQAFMDEQNMFDLRLMNSYGWTDAYVEEISRMDGVVDAEGVTYLDLIARVGDAQEDSAYRFYAIPQTVNQIALRGGRMPQSAEECLADGFQVDESILGKQVTIAQSNDEDSLDSVVYKTYTIVGYVATPIYMDMNRGTTSVGSGSLASYFYLPEDAFDLDYYTEINITIPGDYDIYTDKYNDALEASADQLEPLLEPLTLRRLEEVRQEAEEAYQDGMKEYEDGMEEYADGKAEMEEEIAQAYQDLLDAEQELKDNEQKLIDGEEQIDDAREKLRENEKTLQQSKQTLADSKAQAYQQIADANAKLLENYETVNENMQAVDSGLLQISTGLIELNSGITQLESGLTQLDSGISQMQMLINIMDVSIEAAEQALEFAEETGMTDAGAIEQMNAELEELINTRDSYYAQLDDLNSQREEYGNQLDELYAKQAELEAQQAELETNKALLESGMTSIENGMIELAANQVQMENQFAAADAQIESGEAQLEAYYTELEIQEQEIADGWEALEEGRKELEDGWKEYEDGKLEAESELADAWAELQDAAQELKDARESIDSMTENEIIILDRTSNMGYNNLDSSSDIVSGVSRVFPVFFLLVASLVCITTMTRMIDEERTQIGTLKALGYSNSAIIGKYMIYSGSGAVLGCGLGVLIGSAVFPAILWQAYCIMLYIQPDIVLTMNWPLCIVVVVVYTAVMLFVTWYCCHRTLEEEPAELIRPKAPEAGKKILLERMPFWHNISFLNKVTIRNIFRYRQRLAMMLVGIGGCTALLVTGFGLRDSIVNVVHYQFEEVTSYDLEVYFRDDLTEEVKADFLAKINGSVAESMFYHQSSVELDFDDRVKEIYMISADDALQQFIDLHSGSQSISMPGRNEVVLTVGVAEAMGIDVGDTVIMRDADMRSLSLTVSGIYDNHVYNYSIVHPETIEEHWGSSPAQQMAFVKMQEGKDAHILGAAISEMDDVMNVSVSEDIANMVGSMMDALDLVVIVVVVCAGLLAVIVLYNLTNININERIREIATIKVLGFNAFETAAYVFKENMALTVAGSVIGLLLGKLLLAFVMSQIKIDMVWFKSMVEPLSYLWSIALTLLSAIAVEFIFYFKLEKINMAEALKSVE